MSIGKIFSDKKICGFIWHLIFAGVFIGLSLMFIEFTHGVTWYLISTILRIIFGTAILILSSRLFDRKISDILSFKNIKGALPAGAGFILFFIYYLILFFSGAGGIAGLTAGVFITKILLQQAATGFYEEMNYRFLMLEGLKYTENGSVIKILYVTVSAVLFGLLHCVTGWNTYTFFQTGAIGFAFAVIFVKSGNIVVPMISHFVYDIFAKTAEYIEWNHNTFFDNMNSVFEIMLAMMFVVSFIILVMPQKRKSAEKPA